MPHSAEGKAFLDRIQSDLTLDDVLKPSLDDEVELRRFFATDKANERLKDPYVGLVDVFDAPGGAGSIFQTRARVVENDEELSAKYVMPLAPAQRRKDGDSCIVSDLETFKKNWAIFSEGSLSQLIDWSNVVAAGGSVLACLTPLPDTATTSKRATRKYYHSNAYPTSDVDLFLWGMTPEQAEAKIVKIYEAVRDSVPWDCTCVRTKHTISIHSQYPYRSVQIVLRLYSSVSEILTGFDIDAPCCAYDGERVWANPRAIVAMMRQCNTVDMTRRSPSYEVRLAKYSARSFEVYVPTLSRADIDPTIYERSIARIEGLARLLVFEKIKDTNDRESFIQNRRMLRGRPNDYRGYNYRRQKKYKGDLKGDQSIGGLEMNDYDVASLHIPYGPGWDARRIDKLVYQTDLGMNSTFNPKNKGRRLHRHPAFFGTIEECVEDCCEYCPEAIDDDERKLLEEEDKNYIRGRISFIEENPGRQSLSGSFNPIDVGEWSEQVYVGQTEKFFAAIAAGKRDTVTDMVDKEGIDINRRDHVGRTCLHLAILCKHTAICIDLIERGARISARLVDGRSPLHLAAQYDMLSVAEKLVERSKKNAEALAKDDEDDSNAQGVAPERPSSEDDWTSEDDGVLSLDEDDEADDENEEDDDDEDGNRDDSDGERKAVNDTSSGQPGDTALDEEEDTPDILDVNLADWDLDFTPLSFAILFGSTELVEFLVKEGSSISQVSQPKYYGQATFHPLSLTIIREDEDEACRIAGVLLKAGAVSSTADDSLNTIFHEAVTSGRAKLVAFLLKSDPKAMSVINFPTLNWSNAVFPLSSALSLQDYSMLTTLVAYGAKIKFTEDDVSQALVSVPAGHGRNRYGQNASDIFQNAPVPAEIAMAKLDDVLRLLLALGADFNMPTKRSLQRYGNEKFALLDYARFAQKKLTEDSNQTKAKQNRGDSPSGDYKANWKSYYARHLLDVAKAKESRVATDDSARNAQVEDSIAYYADAEKLLESYGAKTWNELFPDKAQAKPVDDDSNNVGNEEEKDRYYQITTGYRRDAVPQILNASYDELYEACYAGDNDKIQDMCLPAEFANDKNLLSMSVNLVEPDYGRSGNGFTPLYAAFCGRHWNTVQLVYSIIGAQYEPEDKDEKFKSKISFDDDSDDDSEASYDSDDTVEQDQPTFIDVASRPSKVKSLISQKVYLHDTSITLPKLGPNEWGTVSFNLLDHTVRQNDLEGFRHILKLYKAAKDEPLELDDKTLAQILAYDRPDMLDEFIRRSGLGLSIELHHEAEHGDDEPLALNDRNRVYLGLNVHGKKRKDLVRKGDPDAVHSDTEGDVPLVWRAAQVGANAIVQYLAAERPLAAYKHFSMCHNDERALKIRRANLEKVLPEWLGWKVNSLGESPYAAAVLSNKLDTIKLVFNLKSPTVPKTAMHNRIKFIGSNLLTIAVQRGGQKDVIDFLLSRGLDPTVCDESGYNIYHIMCQSNHTDLIEHLFKKLPKDLNESLLAQTSKSRLRTPLHIAVSNGRPYLVKLLLGYTDKGLKSCNVDGFTPLHLAVQAGFPEITALLLQRSSHLVLSENGVGSTTLEMVALQNLQKQMSYHRSRNHNSPSELSQYVSSPGRVVVNSLSKELPKLQATLDYLVRDGKIEADSSIAKAVADFLSFMAPKLEEAKKREVSPPEVEKDRAESYDYGTTYRLLAQAAKGSRKLVHLIDVQRSVEGNLKKFAETPQRVRRNEDELDPEEDEEVIERDGSMVIKQVGWAPETY